VDDSKGCEMQQLNYFGVRKLDWLDVPVPSLPDDDAVIVRPLTVSACDYDGLMIHQGRFQQLHPRTPIPLGHEGEGVIINVGDRVSRFAIGDRVIIPWKIACGTCQSCARKQSAQCQSVRSEDSYSWGTKAGHWGGFLSDAVVVPWADYMLTPLPAGIDPVLTCGVADNISDGWRAVAPGLRERPGGTVLVVGNEPPGSIGLYAAGIAKSLSAGRVVYADHDVDRLTIAENLGVEALDLRTADLDDFKTDLRTLKGGFDITVDSSGNPKMLAALLAATARGGVCTSPSGVLYVGNDPIIPLFDMYRKSVSFHTGWVHTHAIIDEPLELIVSGKFDPSPVTTSIVAWENAIDVLIEPFTKVIMSRPA
jgi:threonine dehydrogenase-like Zn-dependent dehydrogenase